jgi:hypothetical protein
MSRGLRHCRAERETPAEFTLELLPMAFGGLPPKFWSTGADMQVYRTTAVALTKTYPKAKMAIQCAV